MRNRTVDALSTRYSVDERQAARVEETALACLRQVAENWDLRPKVDGQLLAWAARMHEVGHPTVAWTARQLLETFPMDTAPRFLMGDRDSIHGWEVARAINSLSITEVISAPRFIRSIKDECLNRMILFGEAHLRRTIDEFLAHYNHERNHQGIGNELIDARAGAGSGPIECTERLGGLLNTTAGLPDP